MSFTRLCMDKQLTEANAEQQIQGCIAYWTISNYSITKEFVTAISDLGYNPSGFIQLGQWRMKNLDPAGHLLFDGASLLLSGHSKPKMPNIPGCVDWVRSTPRKGKDGKQDDAYSECLDDYNACAEQRTIHQPAHNDGETDGN